ncbi:MAG TPA: limonene-1,2-epoxide hydrolase family protein [Acidimicrobiales bacterium]
MSDATVAGEIGVVRAFFDALEASDIDRALELTDPAIVYQNVPLPPARGREAFERQMRWFERYVGRFEARVHHAAADGHVVLTERTDVMEIGRLRAEFWVCGTFEVRDGRIVLWRDYFDYAAVAAAFARGAVRALVAAARSRTT